MREAERRREQRKRLLTAGASFAAVLVIIGLIVGAKALGIGSPKKAAPASPTQPADASLMKAVTSVPESTLNTVGAGTATNVPNKITAPALTDGGKPKVLYVGAEYCPFCGAERWSLAVALSRFGTLTGLGITHSSSTDVFPNTPTLSFHGSKLTSTYITFVPYEQTTNQPQGSGYKTLDTLSPEDQALYSTYDGPPYVSSTDAGSVPFVDFGGKYILSGVSYDPGLLKGKTHAQIAAALSDPSSPIAKAADGSANFITAAICATTNQQPANVCTATGVQAAASKLGKGS